MEGAQIHFQCSACRTKLRAPISLAGSAVTCPNCKSSTFAPFDFTGVAPLEHAKVAPPIQRPVERSKTHNPTMIAVLSVLLIGIFAIAERSGSFGGQTQSGSSNPQAQQNEEPGPSGQIGTQSESEPHSQATWLEYVADCGLAAQHRNGVTAERIFEERYKGKIVHWTGLITSIRPSLTGDSNFMAIKMEPSESHFSDFDVSLNFSRSANLERFQSGMSISFEGVVTIQGGSLTPHQLDAR